MSKPYLFDDGSIVEWVDKETLRYTENGFSALVWVDFEPGFFSSGRIIRASSLINWESKPGNYESRISLNKKEEIIRKIQDYYRAQNTKCRESMGCVPRRR